VTESDQARTQHAEQAEQDAGDQYGQITHPGPRAGRIHAAACSSRWSVRPY
jgi:hypothetical protein